MKIRSLVLASSAALAAAVPAAGQAAFAPTFGSPLHAVTLAEARLAPVRMAGEREAAFRPTLTIEQQGVSKPHLQYSVPLTLLGAFAGGAAGYGAGFVGLDCSDEGADCANGFDNAEYATLYAGAVLGAAAGAHFGGLRKDSAGNFLATVGGAAVGGIPILLANKEDNLDAPAIGTIVGSAAGAVIVDYLVRHVR